MLIQLHTLLLVSCLVINPLYAPPQQTCPHNPAAWNKKMAKRQIAGASVASKMRSKSAQPAPGSLAKKKARIALKKLQMKLEEALHV